ncbi:ribokinase [Microvirga pudoricolor]|uniref:ribokinase n=1 Tax=Microvirga pudoricolor TaxID=2778729 RepID=UPI0019524C6A|nr:ribokinase [Microvirga pudoricolor]MBM6594437.1 ribokinase [Microvirga pudoricolor]
MIVVFGSINMDLVARVPAIARPGETVLSRRADSFFGGKGANQAVAASRAVREPGSVAMAGAIGPDAFGETCRANLLQSGVDVVGVRLVSEPTGCAFITVDASGENAITVASGANMEVRASDLSDHVLRIASVLVLQMEVPLVESVAAAKRARKGGTKVVWNFAPAPGDGERDTIGEALAATDILVVNEHEAQATASVAGIEHVSTYEGAASALAKEFGLTCLVTAGSLGAFAMKPDGTRLHVPTKAVTPLDTTGAGDTFVGVLAVGIAEALRLEDAMERACIAASLSCLKPGAQGGMPSRNEIDAAIAGETQDPPGPSAAKRPA